MKTIEVKITVNSELTPEELAEKVEKTMRRFAHEWGV